MINNTNFVRVMGYHVFADKLSKIKISSDIKLIINTINPHSYITAKNDNLFKQSLQDSNILIPDGSGIVLAAKQIYKSSVKKIAGADLHFYLLQELNKNKGKVFYMGASMETLEKITKRIKSEFPNIVMDCYSPPFKEKFTDEENKIITDKINKFRPDILFVGMTAPKQEKWLFEHKDKLDFKIASSIGAVFDFYAGTVERPGQFWIDMQLEWLGRLLKEPRRMWKRNFVSTPLFLLDMFLYKAGCKR